MFKKQFRISAKEFPVLLKERKNCVHSPILMVQFVPANEYKFAVVTPKKVFKKAVTRNKIKRTLYGVLKEVCGEQLLPQGVYIVLLKKLAKDKTVREIKRELRELLGKIRSI